MSNAFMADIPTESIPITEDTVFEVGKDEQVKETPESSPDENKPEEETPSHQGEDQPTTETSNDDEENLPFHKHPRWKELQNDRAQMKHELEEMKNLNTQLQQKVEVVEKVATQPKSEQALDIPDWFKGIYGEDANAWNNYQSYQQEERAKIKQELINEERQAKLQQEEQVKKWNKYTEDSISRLESEGKEFNRNELMDVMLKYRPTDDVGNFDFNKGYEILEMVKPSKATAQKSKERKALADVSPSKTSGESKRDYATGDDFRGKSIYDIVRE